MRAAIEESEFAVHAIPHQVGSFRRDVDAHPLPMQLLRRNARRGATAKGIKHRISLVRGSTDNSLK